MEEDLKMLNLIAGGGSPVKGRERGDVNTTYLSKDTANHNLELDSAILRMDDSAILYLNETLRERD